MLRFYMIFETRATIGCKITFHATPYPFRVLVHQHLDYFIQLHFYKYLMHNPIATQISVLSNFQIFCILTQMFISKNVHFQCFSCRTHITTNVTWIALSFNMPRLYMLLNRVFTAWWIFTSAAHPNSFRILIHQRRNQLIKFWIKANVYLGIKPIS